MAILRTFRLMTARGQRRLRRTNLGRARPLIIGAMGGSVLLIGIAMILLPGPAVLVIPLGLAILGTEFLWARRLLRQAKGFIPRRFRHRMPRGT